MNNFSIRYLTILLSVFLCTAFVACSNDDDNDDANTSTDIIGTWELVEAKYDEEIYWEEELQLYEEFNFWPTITFLSNGTLISRDIDHSPRGELITDKGTYTYNSKTGKITTKYPEEEIGVFFIKFTKANTFMMWEEGYEEYYEIWKKKK